MYTHISFPHPSPAPKLIISSNISAICAWRPYVLFVCHVHLHPKRKTKAQIKHFAFTQIHPHPRKVPGPTWTSASTRWPRASTPARPPPSPQLHDSIAPVATTAAGPQSDQTHNLRHPPNLIYLMPTGLEGRKSGPSCYLPSYLACSVSQSTDLQTQVLCANEFPFYEGRNQDHAMENPLLTDLAGIN